MKSIDFYVDDVKSSEISEEELNSIESGLRISIMFYLDNYASGFINNDQLLSYLNDICYSHSVRLIPLGFVFEIQEFSTDWGEDKISIKISTKSIRN